MPPDPLIFVSHPETIPKILDDLCDPDLTLREIAMKAQTTVEALSLWMASPEIAARIELIQSTIAQRTRLAATCFLPAAVRTVNRVLEAYEHEEDHVPIKPGSLIGHEYRRRSRESARRACNLLLRLARFYPDACHGLGRLGHARAGPRARNRTSVGPSTPRAPAPTLHDLRARLSSCLSPVPPDVAARSDSRCGPFETPDTDCPPNRTSGATSHVRILHVPDPALALQPERPDSPDRELGPPATNGHHPSNRASNNEHWP